jgi:hypothetical protein
LVVLHWHNLKTTWGLSMKALWIQVCLSWVMFHRACLLVRIDYSPLSVSLLPTLYDVINKADVQKESRKQNWVTFHITLFRVVPSTIARIDTTKAAKNGYNLYIVHCTLIIVHWDFHVFLFSRCCVCVWSLVGKSERRVSTLQSIICKIPLFYLTFAVLAWYSARNLINN